MGPWVVLAVKSGASSLILSSDMSDVSPEKLEASMNFVFTSLAGDERHLPANFRSGDSTLRFTTSSFGTSVINPL
jgi:hypothetical protein